MLVGDRIWARYEYDSFGKCTVLDAEGKPLTDKDAIGHQNPFRWKGFFWDSESGYYYANGSYYDPETGTYVDAAPITSVVDNAFTPRGLDRNGILCNNHLELAGDPSTVFTTEDLSPDPAYDPGQTWWQKVSKAISDWWQDIPVEQKVAAGLALIVTSVVLAVISGGTSVGPEA